MYETILSPVEIGGLTLKNRIVFAPTSLGLRGEELEQKITAIAEGGCAMIILGDVPVGKHGFGQSNYRELLLIHALNRNVYVILVVIVILCSFISRTAM